jgi:hypothetical protein
VDSRESFRGRAEQGRQEISRGGVSDRMAGSGNRASQQPSNRMSGGGRESGAFQGVGNGAQTRDHSNRGASSRQNSSFGGGGGSRGSFGGGGGGGGRGGGGGGRGGGGRR